MVTGIEQFKALGVDISVLDQDRAREFLFETVREGRRGYVTITNVYSVSEAQRDPFSFEQYCSKNEYSDTDK